MISRDQAKHEATHTDAAGNLYRVVGDKPQAYCVNYFDNVLCVWVQDMGKDFSHLIPLNKAYLAIQCRAHCGAVGSFLFSRKDERGFVPVSPVFNHLPELFAWVKANGWQSVEGLYDYYEKPE